MWKIFAHSWLRQVFKNSLGRIFLGKLSICCRAGHERGRQACAMPTAVFCKNSDVASPAVGKGASSCPHTPKTDPKPGSCSPCMVAGATVSCSQSQVMRASHGDSKVSELLKRKPSHKDVQPLRRKARHPLGGRAPDLASRKKSMRGAKHTAERLVKSGSSTSSQSIFCLKRLSRHYLPPVAASGEKDESEVRTSRTVQKG